MKHARLSSSHLLMTFVQREWLWLLCCSTFSIFNKNTNGILAYYWQKVHLWDAVETLSPALDNWSSWGIVFQCAVWAPDVYSREVEVGGGRGRRYQALTPRCEKTWHSSPCFLLGTVRPSLLQQWNQEDVSSPSNTLACPPSLFLFFLTHTQSFLPLWANCSFQNNEPRRRRSPLWFVVKASLLRLHFMVIGFSLKESYIEPFVGFCNMWWVKAGCQCICCACVYCGLSKNHHHHHHWP